MSTYPPKTQFWIAPEYVPCLNLSPVKFEIRTFCKKYIYGHIWRKRKYTVSFFHFDTELSLAISVRFYSFLVLVKFCNKKVSRLLEIWVNRQSATNPCKKFAILTYFFTNNCRILTKLSSVVKNYVILGGT